MRKKTVTAIVASVVIAIWGLIFAARRRLASIIDSDPFDEPFGDL